MGNKHKSSSSFKKKTKIIAINFKNNNKTKKIINEHIYLRKWQPFFSLLLCFCCLFFTFFLLQINKFLTNKSKFCLLTDQFDEIHRHGSKIVMIKKTQLHSLEHLAKKIGIYWLDNKKKNFLLRNDYSITCKFSHLNKINWYIKSFFFLSKYSISKQLNSIIIIMKEMFNDFVVVQILEN